MSGVVFDSEPPNDAEWFFGKPSDGRSNVQRSGYGF